MQILIFLWYKYLKNFLSDKKLTEPPLTNENHCERRSEEHTVATSGSNSNLFWWAVECMYQDLWCCNIYEQSSFRLCITEANFSMVKGWNHRLEQPFLLCFPRLLELRYRPGFWSLEWNSPSKLTSIMFEILVSPMMLIEIKIIIQEQYFGLKIFELVIEMSFIRYYGSKNDVRLESWFRSKL